jgi:hypothetical protein
MAIKIYEKFDLWVTSTHSQTRHSRISTFTNLPCDAQLAPRLGSAALDAAAQNAPPSLVCMDFCCGKNHRSQSWISEQTERDPSISATTVEEMEVEAFHDFYVIV